MSNIEIDAHAIIAEEITKLPGDKSQAGDTVMVCCPFHEDNTPSCGIYMAQGMEIPLGFFNCLGCGEKGPWNKLAERANLQGIKEWQVVNSTTDSLVAKARSMETRLLHKSTNIAHLIKSLGNPAYIPWPERKDWRGFKGKLIKSAGGLSFIERNQELMCFFPVKIGRIYVGGVKAYLRKQLKGTSYVTTKGEWAKDSGLFGYDLCKELIKKHKCTFVILVEGPRDALRLLSLGFPAIAVLGSQQFSTKKASKLLSLKVNVYTMTDNDPAGISLRNLIDRAFNYFKIEINHFKLPREKDKNGNLIKMDPGNAPREIIEEVRDVLKDKGEKGFNAKRLGFR